jgi:hypothetical protein
MRSDNKYPTPDPDGSSAPVRSTPDAGPANSMKMQPEDFAGLRAQAAAIGQQDIHLGRMLDNIILHLGHVFDLDPAKEDARLAAKERERNRAEEDAQEKAAAEQLATSRAAEDAQALPPEQVATRTTARAAEDVQLQNAADEQQRVRAEEDKQAADTAKGADHAN